MFGCDLPVLARRFERSVHGRTPLPARRLHPPPPTPYLRRPLSLLAAGSVEWEKRGLHLLPCPLDPLLCEFKLCPGRLSRQQQIGTCQHVTSSLITLRSVFLLPRGMSPLPPGLRHCPEQCGIRTSCSCDVSCFSSHWCPIAPWPPFPLAFVQHHRARDTRQGLSLLGRQRACRPSRRPLCPLPSPTSRGHSAVLQTSTTRKGLRADHNVSPQMVKMSLT